MHRKLQFLIMSVLLLSAGSALAQTIPYVRKQLEPKFFIPEEARQQPEKLPVPRYYKGQEVTIKAAKPEPAVRVLTTENSEEENTEDSTEKPLYQHKFDEYSRDLEHINQTGKIPENKNLENDLQQMNSSQRQLVKRRSYQSRNTREKFDNALQNSLNQN